MNEKQINRFWSTVDQTTGCWSWTGTLLADGYGKFRVCHQAFRAHRVAYELLVGPIPDGLQLDHTCHTHDKTCSDGISCVHRRCVNPLHLEPVTPKENTRRGMGVAGINARKTHCKRGHVFSTENTALLSTGRGRVGRVCLTCNPQRRSQWAAMQAEPPQQEVAS